MTVLVIQISTGYLRPLPLLGSLCHFSILNFEVLYFVHFIVEVLLNERAKFRCWLPIEMSKKLVPKKW